MALPMSGYPPPELMMLAAQQQQQQQFQLQQQYLAHQQQQQQQQQQLQQQQTADLWLKIDQLHLNYLKAEESTKKLDIRKKLEGKFKIMVV